MKKGKFLLVTVLVSILMPLCVNAKEAVNVYIFKGKTCGYCAKALDFFTKLKEDKDYKDIFNLVEYEIWYNEDNNDLAAAVAEEMGDELDGVPYIVIGDETFSGYTSSYDDQIKKAIKDYYAEENPVDKVANIKASGEYKGASADTTTAASGEGSNYSKNESKADTAIAIGIIVVAVVGFGYIIYLSRKDTDVPEKKEPKKEVVKEEKKVEEVKTEAKEKTTPKKQTTTTKKSPTKAKTTTKPKQKAKSTTTKRKK